MRRAGIVLCGGRSRRMGRDKALLPWSGATLVEHVVSILGPCVDAVYVVTSQNLDLPEGRALARARRVIDREPERGPLAALRDGLAAAGADGAEVAFVTATDAPDLTPEWVAGLFEQARVGDRAGVCAVVPHAEGFAQVLSAVYPCAAVGVADALLASGIASPAALLDRIDSSTPAFESPAVGRAPWQGFNTPQQYLLGVRARDPSAKALVEWRRPPSASAMSGARFVARCRVAVGTLAEVLQAARSAAFRDDAAFEPTALRIALAGRVLAGAGELGMPIGPDERVLVDELVEAPPAA